MKQQPHIKGYRGRRLQLPDAFELWALLGFLVVLAFIGFFNSTGGRI